MILSFGVWAPSEDIFWQSWIARGICTKPYTFAQGYSGIETTTSWGGIVTQTPAVIDPKTMQVITPAVLVPGWHTNVRVTNPDIVSQMTYGLEQVDSKGKQYNLWLRTRAAQFFGLTPVATDPTTKFPMGMMGDPKFGVRYCDPSAFVSPRNVWA